MKPVLAGLAAAVGLGVGLWLFEQLRDPISTVRLRLSELVDYAKGET